jgi:hypothetical protein
MFCKGQALSPDKYGVALSELTTFADSPGFMEEIELENNNINWEKTEDGYYYSKDIRYTSIFTYKTIFSKDNTHIVNVYLSSTGTADLSYILRVKAFNNKLVLLDVIAGGDRCQKGINLDEVKIDNGVMYYSHFITPQHLMSWNKEKKKADSYSNCMICCCGFANFHYDLLSNKKYFDNITLIKDAIEKDEFIRDAYNDFIRERDQKDDSYLILGKQNLDVFINAVEAIKNTPPKEGALKIKDGVLIYYNYQNPFTISLKGDVDLSKQTITISGNLFDFTYGISKEFGEIEKEILINYMKWEVNYLEGVHKKTVKTENRFINNNGTLINLWNYINPVMLNDEKFNKKAFFADFYKNGFVYRFSFIAFKGTEEEANKNLIEYVNNIHFYDEQINIPKLQEAIRNGNNMY